MRRRRAILIALEQLGRPVRRPQTPVGPAGRADISASSV